MILGVTGTRQGWTKQQAAQGSFLFLGLNPTQLFHGDCIGVDKQVHDFFRKSVSQRWEVVINIYPCNIPSQRAYCKDANIYEPRPPLKRNYIIVEMCELLVAFPKLRRPEQRSGTWATIRYAILQRRPTIVVWPTGEVEVM